MSNILFLCQRLPYPPNKGEKIRAFHFIRHLGGRHRVFLGCFVEGPDRQRPIEPLQDICAEIRCVSLDKSRALLKAALGLVGSAPLSVRYFADKRMARWINDIGKREKIDAVVIFSSAMAQYLDALPPPRPRSMIDFVDVDSDKWQQYAATRGFPMNLIYRREARTLAAYDRAWAGRADAATFISKPEADLFKRIAPECAERIHVIANGVDCAHFAPHSVTPIAEAEGPVIVFSGTMNYWPNEDAARWFATDIFPSIRARYPMALFYIVGADPGPSITALSNDPQIRVTGRVADPRPYLERADAVVAPMRIARGVQNKVLEGLAMAKPVITTPQGLEGLDAEAGRHVLVAQTAEAFARSVLDVLESDRGGTLGKAGRAHVLQHYGWEHHLRALDRILGL